MYVTAIVLAAGKGTRFSRLNSSSIRGGIPPQIRKMIWAAKSRFSKPLVIINSKPIIAYSLLAFAHNPKIKEIIVVANALNKKGIAASIKKYRIGKVKKIVLGGTERQDSVYNGLKAIDACADLVIIHDGGRPFIGQKIITAAIKEAAKSGAAIVGVPVKATIKQAASGYIEKTLNRDILWEIQTPQAFKKDLILRAFKKFGRMRVTDDAMLVEKLGVKPRLVLGSYKNIKITTPEDLIFAQAIAGKWKIV